MSADSVGEQGAATVGVVRTVPFRIFINYRRGDSGGYAGRLYDSLASHSDDWQVFMDIDTIEPGVDFTEVIDRELETCDVVVAMVGPHWLAAEDSAGRRRLDNPDDFVRAELEAALARDIRVIPAQVQGAGMPSSDQLPDPLRRFARRNALELSDARWRYDVDRLVQLLERAQQLEEEGLQAARVVEQERLEREAQERLEREQALQKAAALEVAERKARERAEREAQKEAEKERARAKAAVTAPDRLERRRRFSRRGAVLLGVAALAIAGGAVAAVLIATGSSDTSGPDAIAPPPKPRIVGYQAAPTAPVAGKPFDIQLSVVQADTGKPIPAASTTCRARAGSRSLAGSSRTQSGGRFHCAWNIPATAAGLRLAGEMRVVYKGAPVVRPFSMPIASLPASLTLLGQPTTAPARPEAGNDLRATTTAGWARKGTLVRSLDPAASAVSCRAKVGDSTLRVTTAKVNARSVVCVWPIPAGAGDKVVYAVITVRSKGQVAKKSFNVRVRSASPAPVSPAPSPSPSPSPQPVAPSPSPSPPPAAPEPVIPP